MHFLYLIFVRLYYEILSKNGSKNLIFRQFFLACTGEILSEEEMREFDGDIYEPHDIDEPETATKQSNPNEIFALFGNKVEVR